MNINLKSGSDKEYWHRYMPIYEEKLKNLGRCNKILEFGVLKGDSIRWLHSTFPNADIYGCDILDIQPEWPASNNIKYFYVDQGNPNSIKGVFEKISQRLDLIIEDGSHQPQHQKNCFAESLKHLSPGGMYILEDIHTSHPGHPYYRESFSGRLFKLFKKNKPGYIGPLHLLLCLEHFISNERELDENTLNEISKNSLFTREEIIFIFQKTATIEINKRATLPHKCYSCNSTDFNYHTLKCTCGADIYSGYDSMTAIITMK